MRPVGCVYILWLALKEWECAQSQTFFRSGFLEGSIDFFTYIYNIKNNLYNIKTI